LASPWIVFAGQKLLSDLPLGYFFGCSGAIFGIPSHSMSNGTASRIAISCTADATALAALPGRRPDVDIVQHGSGLALEPVGRAPETWFPQQLAPHGGNEVIAYIYGKCLFLDIAAALDTAISEDHRIYLLGWDGEKGTQLTPGKTLEDYLKSTRAQVRAMFWDGLVFQPVPALKIPSAQASPWLSKSINDLPNGACIIDRKHAQPATHHQKLLVVQGACGLIAFVGGMDIMPNRANVNPNDGRWPWHDVHVRLRGPAAMECRDVFQERWSDHPESFRLDLKLGGPDHAAFPTPSEKLPAPTVTIPQGGLQPPARWVRIGRTYPKLRKWGGGADYGFATQGNYGAWSLVERGIRSARRFIYLEDQYLVSRMARQLLIEKLNEKGFQFLLMLMNNSGAAAEDYKFIVSERNRFREELRNVDKLGSRWGLYILKRAADQDQRKWCGTYMHSKTWIVDDEFAIVGSANCENRGYTLNTEAVAAIADDVRVRYAGRGFARQLRIALWHKHLGIPHDRLQDWSRGLSLWATAPASAMIENASAQEPDPDLGGKFLPDASEKPNVERLWTTLCDPDAR
jgi:phosphatidylserine/phosphatidylglycerophosphate/cardiolipin synthase-like enzyme